MNQAVNFFWTILCFIPVVFFWFTDGSMYCLYMFIVISLLCLFIPSGLLQLSYNPEFYVRLGVKQIKKFVQNGELVNKLIRKKNPDYRVIQNRSSAVKYINTIRMYERYHFLCLIFFLLTAIYGITIQKYFMSALIIISNFIYNILTILLQQYNLSRTIKIRH